MGELREFESYAKEAGESIMGFDRPLLVHHFDCDGCSAGAIAVKALKGAGKQFSRISVKYLNSKVLVGIARRRERQIVFLDCGTGIEKFVSKRFGGREIIVLDHHPKVGGAASKKSEAPREIKYEVNPNLFGFDGSWDASGSTVAWFSFRRLLEPSATRLAVVGAVGDTHDVRWNGLRSLNAVPLNEGIAAGEIERKRDLKMFGRVSRPLVSWLKYSTEPYLPGLTGDMKACVAFLQDNGVPVEENGRLLHYFELGDANKKRLSSALITHCVKKGMGEETLQGLIGEVYEFPKEPRDSETSDSHELSTVLNACGRWGRSDVAVNLCLEGTKFLARARAIALRHRARVYEALMYAKRVACDAGEFCLIDGRGRISENIIGTVAMIAQGAITTSKPVVALANGRNVTKVSSRASKQSVEHGVNLGEAMGEAAFGIGEGGGHRPAAGATIKRGSEKEFLKKCREVIRRQLGRKH
jgi:RecJ-like exonuclease